MQFTLKMPQLPMPHDLKKPNSWILSLGFLVDETGFRRVGSSIVMGRALKTRARAGPGLGPFPGGRAPGRAGLGPFIN